MVRVRVWRAGFAIAALAAVPQGASASDAGPYASLEQRPIASLSEADVADLLAGRGFGFALPAELHSYPGPTHLMELADPLALSEDQRDAIAAIYGTMRDEAVPLGEAYVAAEAALDRAFAERTIDAAGIGALTAEAAQLEGALRAVHLRAHIAVRPLLTTAQIAAYDRLRGYEADAEGHRGHGRQHGAH